MVKKLLLPVLFFTAAMLFAAEIEGVFFPDAFEIAGKKLVLNGTGLRLKKVVFWNVKVYAAGLYLEQKENNPQRIITDEETKVIVMRFIYSNVSKDKLQEAFLEGFESNGKAEAAKLKSQIDKFLSLWSDMAKDDEAKLIYIPGAGTKVIIKNKEAGVIEGADFGKLLFSVWLGPNPPNPELKAGLLGN